MVTCGSMTVLKEPHSSYNTLFDGKKAALSLKNTYRIDVIWRYYKYYFGLTPDRDKNDIVSVERWNVTKKIDQLWLGYEKAPEK